MTQLKILFPGINLFVFFFVSILFVVAHGGAKGDAIWIVGGTDTVSEPADKGLVFFNRWNFDGNGESAVTKTFLIVNLVPFFVAKLTLGFASSFWEQFQSPQPFGISYGTYTLLLAIPLSLLQWFGIGLIVDRLRNNRAH